MIFEIIGIENALNHILFLFLWTGLRLICEMPLRKSMSPKHALCNSEYMVKQTLKTSTCAMVSTYYFDD